MKRIVLLSLTIALGAIGFFAATALAHNARQASVTVSLRKTPLGAVLVNSRGHTLYLFGKDRQGKSACTGPRAKVSSRSAQGGTPSLQRGRRC